MFIPPVRRSVLLSSGPLARSATEQARDQWWIWAILALQSGPLTFTELQRRSGRFVPRSRLLVLLIELEQTLVVCRERPVQGRTDTSYRLTDLGMDLAGLIVQARRTLATAAVEDARHRLPFPEDVEASFAALAFKGLRRQAIPH